MIVCLITPGHLASDPRLIKEAKALSENGIAVHLIFTQYVRYLVKYDQLILESNPEWTYDCLDWTGSSSLSKIIRLRSKLHSIFNNDYKISPDRNHNWLFKKAVAITADLYIAHNLGALPAAVCAAKKNNAKSGFDAEDFHRFEISNNINEKEVKLKITIEDNYIPQLDYLTASSPKIAYKYSALYHLDVKTILNAFPKTRSVNITANITTPLQLFWFSQTIGPNRGIEAVIQGIGMSGIRINLHLLGDISKEYKDGLLYLIAKDAPLCNLQFYTPVRAEQIFEIAYAFDIGLAAEPHFPLNRNICLTNKLFTYIQSGLAVLASDTVAQVAFFSQLPEAGIIYKDSRSLAEAITAYHLNRERLFETRKMNYLAGQSSLNWETEAPKFIETIYRAIN